MKLSELRQLNNYLYHGTSFFNLVNIISSNKLNASDWGTDGSPIGVSLSRDIRVANRFMNDGEGSSGGVLALDRQRLSATYKIVSFADPVVVFTESEEVVIADPLYPLDKYLEFFILSDNTISKSTSENDIEWAVDEMFFSSINEAMDRISYASNHPKRRQT